MNEERERLLSCVRKQVKRHDEMGDTDPTFTVYETMAEIVLETV